MVSPLPILSLQQCSLFQKSCTYKVTINTRTIGKYIINAIALQIKI